MVDFSGGAQQQPPAEERSFEDVNRSLNSCALEVARHLVPGGRVAGHEYVAGDLHGGKGRSFSIRVGGNHDVGVWKDFAADTGGADLINLFAAVKGLSQIEAKREAERWLGLGPRERSKENVTAGRAVRAPTVKGQDDDPLWWRGVQAERRWDYYGADGQLFGCVYRFKHPKTGDKTIRPWCPATQQWETPDGPRPLLYLPDILKGQGPVVLVEGEKCADAIRAIDMLGSTVMGGAQAIGKTDLWPLKGRDVVLWRDNDSAGLSWTEKLTEALREIGPASVRLIGIPDGKPEKWDAADAEEAERRALIVAALESKAVVTGRPILRIADWTAAAFEGVAPERQWLIREVFPAAVAVILAAMGDTGKGMMLLDLALKVSAGTATWDGPVAFGCTVARFGRVVILSAEDDYGELHRRIERLDPDLRYRQAAGDRLIIVPLPNVGGAMPLIKATGRGVETTDDFLRIRDQLLALDDLALVVIDPLAAFVQADLNKDSAAAAFVGGQLAALASDTGATVIAAHHMRKAGGKDGIQSPEMAREAIRGQSGIVDGVRAAYALWPVADKEAKDFLGKIKEDTTGERWRNRVVKGAVVKSNGPSDRTVRTYVRDTNSGLLVDRTLQEQSIRRAEQEDMLRVLQRTLSKAAEDGRPYTHTGSNGVYALRERLPGALRNMGKNRLEALVQAMLDGGKIVKCVAQGSTTAKWLDVPEGPFGKGEGVFEKGGAPAGEGEG